MRVLFLMISYPDLNKNTNMYTDLAQEFVLNGHEVFVAVSNGPYKTSLNIEGGVNVLRVRTLELFNTSFIKKGLANILLGYQVTTGIKKYWRDIPIDTVIVSTPPITYLSTITAIKKFFKVKIYLILRDIFPQNARDLGIIKSRILFGFFRKKEKQLYSTSDYIGCMSKKNITYVESHNPEISIEKLHLLPNWKNVEEYIQPDLKIKNQYGLDNNFIAIYGGNFGKPQQLEFVLELAEKVRYLKDVVFLFIGSGTEKQKIAEKVAKREVKNVIIMDPLPRNKYLELVKVCDIGLVNLSNRFTIPNVPSRTLSYWEAKLPVLAAIDKNTDFCTILEQSASGLWSISGDMDTYIQNFEKLYFNSVLRSNMGNNGYKYLKENCTTSHAYSIIRDRLLSTNI